MKVTVSTGLLIIFINLSLTAQQDPAAREILDKFARNAESDFPVRIEFEYTFESLVDDETFTEPGELILNGNQYRLILQESEIISNGLLMWNWLKSEDEVYISDPNNMSEESDFFITSPEKLFTFYSEDFKYRLTGELNHLGMDYYQVDLFPFDLNRSYHTITLLIQKDNYRLFSLETRGKQGVNHIITIKEYQAKYKTTEETFTFDPSQYPQMEVIDTRL
jgi:outer membrane lipoprotein-sorting protein